ANNWCHRGVELLTTIPYDFTVGNAANALTAVDKYIEEGELLKYRSGTYCISGGIGCNIVNQVYCIRNGTCSNLDTFNNGSDLNKLIMLTTTDTSTLLAQVAERIDDMRLLSISRRDALRKMALREVRKPPVQVVSPEKLPYSNGDKICSMSDNTNSISASPTKVPFLFTKYFILIS
ncbi:unnamed protein product, partial [Onchocerca ochengi]|uniref:Variant surface glycoprotein n=1 Tax=Onchocerca ochengi TaxID=42157 RepID=A0A182EPL8_ONCOC